MPGKRLSKRYPYTKFGYTRDEHPESFCRATPHASKRDRHFLFSRINTLTELESFLLDEISGKSNMTKEVDLIVVRLEYGSLCDHTTARTEVAKAELRMSW
jgi:hypothetical protein